MSLILTCLGGPLLYQLIAACWGGYKARANASGIPMVFCRGQWSAGKLIPRVERAGEWFGHFGLVCVGLGVVGAVYGALK